MPSAQRVSSTPRSRAQNREAAAASEHKDINIVASRMQEVYRCFPDVYHRLVELEHLADHLNNCHRAKETELLRSINVGQELIEQIDRLRERCCTLADERDAALRQCEHLAKNLQQAREAPPLAVGEGTPSSDTAAREQWWQTCQKSWEEEREQLLQRLVTDRRELQCEMQALLTQRDTAMKTAAEVSSVKTNLQREFHHLEGRNRMLVEQLRRCEEEVRSVHRDLSPSLQPPPPAAADADTANSFHSHAPAMAELHTAASLSLQVHQQAQELLYSTDSPPAQHSALSSGALVKMGQHSATSLVSQWSNTLKDTLVLLGGLKHQISVVQQRQSQQDSALVEEQRARLRSSEYLEALRSEVGELKYQLRQAKDDLSRREVDMECMQADVARRKEESSASVTAATARAQELEVEVRRLQSESAKERDGLVAEFAMELDRQQRLQGRLEKEVAHLKSLAERAKDDAALQLLEQHNKLQGALQREASLRDEIAKLERAVQMGADRSNGLQRQLDEQIQSHKMQRAQSEEIIRRSQTQLEADYASLSKENTHLKEQIESLHRRTQDELDKSVQSAMEADKKHQQVLSELNQLKHTLLPDLQRRHDTLKEANQKNETELTALKATQRELLSTEQVVTQLTQELEASKRTVEEASRRCDDLRVKLNTSVEAERLATTALTAMTAEKQELSHKLKSFRDETASMQEQLSALAEDAVQENVRLTEQVALAQQEADSLHTQLTRLETRCTLLEKTCNEKEAEVVRLQEAVRVAELASESAKSLVADSDEKWLSQEQRYQRTVSDLEEETARLERKLELKEESLARLETDVLMLKEELSTAHQSIRIANDRVGDSEQAYAALQEQVRKDSAQQAARMRDQVEKLARDRSAVQEERDSRHQSRLGTVSEMEQANTEKEMKIREMQAVLKSSKLALAEARAAITSRESCVVALEEEVQRLRKERQTLQVSLSEHQTLVRDGTVPKRDYDAAMEASRRLESDITDAIRERDEAVACRRKLEAFVMDGLSQSPLSASRWEELSGAMALAHSTYCGSVQRLRARTSADHHPRHRDKPDMDQEHFRASSMPLSHVSRSPPSPPEQVVTTTPNRSRDASCEPPEDNQWEDNNNNNIVNPLLSSIEGYLAFVQYAIGAYVDGHSAALKQMKAAILSGYYSSSSIASVSGSALDASQLGDVSRHSVVLAGIMAKPVDCDTVVSLAQKVADCTISVQKAFGALCIAGRQHEEEGEAAKRYKAEVDLLHETVAHYEERLEVLEKQRSQLDQRRRSEQGDTQSELQRLQTSYEQRLAAQSAEHKDERGRWVTELTALKKQRDRECAAMRAEMDADRVRKGELERQSYSYVERIREDTLLRQQLEEKVKSLHERSNQMQLTSEKRLKELQAEHAKLHTALKAAQSDAIRHARELSESHQQREKGLTVYLETALDRVAALEADKKTSTGRDSHTIEELQTEVVKLRGSLRRLEMRHAESEKSFSLLEKVHESEHTELEALRQVNLSLESRLSEIEGDREPLRQQLHSLLSSSFS